ncbi:protein of unknown function [Tenacibaculum sp. 190524A02b]
MYWLIHIMRHLILKKKYYKAIKKLQLIVNYCATLLGCNFEKMKRTILLLIPITFFSCYFGANEYSGKITRDFYLIAWDDKFWQISRSNNNSEFNPENIIISHDVFAIGNTKNFIIAIQHPCKNEQNHLNDYFDDSKINKEITNYYIIELLKNEKYRINKFDNKTKYLVARTELGVPEDLDYKFYKETLE